MNRQRPHHGRGGSRPSHPHVPPSRSINPGTAVKIVLKADQPTGRTVSGTVGEVLTRGDHPRGVKVRLTDGRVGRVQSLRSSDEPSQKEVGERGGSIGDGGGMQLRAEGGDWSGRLNRFAARDMRLDGPEEPSSEPLGLDMYIRPAKGKKRGEKTHSRQNGDKTDEGIISTAAAGQMKAASVSCPVCATFEGDEAAVAHHVAGHFEE
ncbi:hypothetical protein N7532_003309 [Penicillium argentinense]|uniref:UBZ4-type domain-containing protein n=1 Tax=Penicillium argentinense TaxID=1131581 RepID=A0A9W9KDS4_9EURO|nr:uncharacterized protein N7532_003309 [Penicillium argentinense]KAJ5102780.1 hypothetical protein N7532_003309 [Penicillium argentinense]